MSTKTHIDWYVWKITGIEVEHFCLLGCTIPFIGFQKDPLLSILIPIQLNILPSHSPKSSTSITEFLAVSQVYSQYFKMSIGIGTVSVANVPGVRLKQHYIQYRNLPCAPAEAYIKFMSDQGLGAHKHKTIIYSWTPRCSTPVETNASWTAMCDGRSATGSTHRWRNWHPISFGRCFWFLNCSTLLEVNSSHI